MTRSDILVVSHPAVLPGNQLVYDELINRGYQVDLLVPAHWRHDYSPSSFDARPLPSLVGRFYPKRVIGAGRPQRHVYLSNPFLELLRRRPSLLFCEQEPFSASAAQWGLAAWVLGIPFGVQMDENLDRTLPPLARLFRNFVLPRASFVAARSPAAAGLAATWRARGTVRLIPHHIPSWPEPERHPHLGFTIGYAGRLVEEKGLDTLVAATRRLGGDVELLVIGDGPLRLWLESVDMGEARLRLVRPAAHEDMPSLYAQMDVLVLPSLTTPKWAEQFGRVLVEAMSCGTPVVGSSSGEIQWVISATGGGETFPEGNDEALVSVLRRLRGDHQLRGSLAERGRKQAVALFSVNSVTDRMCEVLRDIIPQSSRSLPSSKPRVALVAHGLHDGGGMERACAELIRSAHREFDFFVVSADLDPGLRPLVKKWDRVQVPMRPIPLKFAVFWVRAGRALRHLDVDLIHTVGAIVPNRVELATIHFCHAAFVAKGHRLAPEDAPTSRQLNTAIARVLAVLGERWVYRPSRLRAFGAVSEEVAEELARHYSGIPIWVTPNGVDLGRFHPDRCARVRVRSAENVADETLIALFVGGDWNRKGLRIAIGAVAAARASGVDVELWVVGDGDRGRFARFSADIGLGDHVQFFGNRADIEHLYQAADVFVLPSAYETFSIVCFEAAACGLPLLISPISGARKIVSEDAGGYQVERRSSSVSAGLIRLASDPALRTTLGSEARRRVQNYGWENSTQSVTNVYNHLLRRYEG